jgi:DNA-binding MarR family transcriptional regulator
VDIHITPKGQRVLEKIDKESGQWTATLQKLSPSEARQLNVLLDKMRG